jgi:CBS domain-containing protein
LAQVLNDNGITGAPVVDGQGNVLGVVSQTDLVRAERESSPAEIPSFHKDNDESITKSGFHYLDADHRRVQQIMTPGGLSFGEDTPVEDIARLMLDRKVHRVLITRRGTLCGIVTTMDVLRAFVNLPTK